MDFRWQNYKHFAGFGGNFANSDFRKSAWYFHFKYMVIFEPDTLYLF
jgi:hypothetical protein